MDKGTWEKIDKIDGWLFKEEADLLHRLNMGVWCEVGSWKGRSTAVLAQRGRGYAIDWFNGIEDPNYNLQGIDTYNEYMNNIEPYKVNVITIAKKFQDAVDDVPEVDLLFLDGEHSYELTKLAFDLYNSHVKVGGNVVFHDAWGEKGERVRTPLPEVTKFVKELLQDDRWLNTENVCRCAVFKRLK